MKGNRRGSINFSMSRSKGERLVYDETSQTFKRLNEKMIQSGNKRGKYRTPKKGPLRRQVRYWDALALKNPVQKMRFNEFLNIRRRKK